MKKEKILYLGFFLFVQSAFGLEPSQILIIANGQNPKSVRVASYYCIKRKVPSRNVILLSLGANLTDSISRSDYQEKIAAPVRDKLYNPEFAGKIRCLLTTYGVPFKVGPREPLNDQQEKLADLKQQLEQGKLKKTQLEMASIDNKDFNQIALLKKQTDSEVARLQSASEYINGKETNASVDSELSMVLYSDYELYRWQPNRLMHKLPVWDYMTMMVSRLDGPSAAIAKGLVDKAITEETNGPKGCAYIDWGYSVIKNGIPGFAAYDKSLQKLADFLRAKTRLTVVEEKTVALFSQGQCPDTFIYCGWYSLKRYIDAFDFADGAVGYHIASWEAVDLRDPNSGQWCPNMLAKGITATIGAVAEPYLQSFPAPEDFFAQLVKGNCLVEAYYQTNPYNSWQFVLIGDPLYRPFKKTD